jgi:hypothetical protein
MTRNRRRLSEVPTAVISYYKGETESNKVQQEYIQKGKGKGG